METKITLNHNKNIPITTKHLITTKNVQQGGKNIPAYITKSRDVLVETSNERKNTSIIISEGGEQLEKIHDKYLPRYRKKKIIT